MSDQLSWISCLQESGRNADGMVDLSSVIRARRQELYVQILKETGSTMVKKNLVLKEGANGLGFLVFFFFFCFFFFFFLFFFFLLLFFFLFVFD
jgi:hypothetical protein